MKLAVFSPLNPVKTGVSDYTEELLEELSRHFKLELFCDPRIKPDNPEVVSRYPVKPFEPESFQPGEYDEILYHIGNNYPGHAFVYEGLKRFPGIVVLHDYVLQGFYAERYDITGDFNQYRSLLSEYYGEEGEIIAGEIRDKSRIPIWESERALEFPLNQEIVDLSKGVIVHSDFVRTRLQSITSRPVVKIALHGHRLKKFDSDPFRKEYQIDPKELLLVSAGFINKNKRFARILNALREVKDMPWKYIIAGEDRGRLLDRELHGLEKNVLRRPYLPILELERLIAAADICINLRHPTMGESSGSLLRMMGYGKPTLVSNFGSYAEFPDYSVLKIDPDLDEEEMIKRMIEALGIDRDFRLSVGREAADYISSECSLEKCAELYASFIQSIQG